MAIIESSNERRLQELNSNILEERIEQVDEELE